MKTIDYTHGFKLSKKNFKNLFTASKQASTIKNYGLACSLNILACEELIKSFVLHLKVLHPEISFIGMDEIFKNHIHKHKELKGFLQSTNSGTEIFEFNILEDSDEFLTRLTEDKIAEYQKEIKDIERVKKRTEIIRQFKVSVDDIFSWLKQANTEKNAGLYVGYDKNNNLWQSPQKFTKKQYKKEMNYTKLLKLHFDNAIDVTHFVKELRQRGLIEDEY
ncbi:AbiV family abortive infection protein [Sphingobacterium spiritivorum]|uniref:AbiV family abortive infection protein n=1 Tax=Sphingobacterium spiritivorum TaxID=258 RepID=UPI003DA5BA8C